MNNSLKVSDILNCTKNTLLLPPILFGSYIASKQLDMNIDISYFNQAFNTLSNDFSNSATLLSLITSSYLIARTESSSKILGSLGFMISNVALISKALESNPEPFFITQNAILTLLSAKTILYELKQNKENNNLEKQPQDNKIKEFLSNKINGINKSFERFCDNIKTKVKDVSKNENGMLMSAMALTLSTYFIAKNTPVDMNLLMNHLDTISQKGQQMLAMGLTFYGSYKLSQGKAFETGVSYMGANALWFLNANSNLHELTTVLFSYTAALMAYNGAKDLELKDKLPNIKELLNGVLDKLPLVKFNSLSNELENTNNIMNRGKDDVNL